RDLRDFATGTDRLVDAQQVARAGEIFKGIIKRSWKHAGILTGTRFDRQVRLADGHIQRVSCRASPSYYAKNPRIMRQIHVHLLPELSPPDDLKGATCVVIDVL